MLGRRDSDVEMLFLKERESIDRDFKIESEINFLKQNNSELQDILNHQERELQDHKLKLIIQSNEL